MLVRWGCSPTSQNFAHSPARKNSTPSKFTPTKFLSPTTTTKGLFFPVNNNFHVITQKIFICSCSHCSCTIFTSTSYSLHTQLMLIFNCNFVIVALKKTQNGQNYSSSDSYQLITVRGTFLPPLKLFVKTFNRARGGGGVGGGGGVL